MAWDKQAQIASANRDSRMARRVMERLRQCGYVVEWIDARSAYGLRLMPANLRVNGRYVLCRAVGYQCLPDSADTRFILAENALLQLGASDITALLRALQS